MEIYWVLWAFGSGKTQGSLESLRLLGFFQPPAWVCIGDFNEIIEDAKKFVVIKKPRWQMKDFQDAIETCQLFDLGYSGPKFTWSNKKEDHYFTQEQLDRALENSVWIDEFRERSVEVMAACNSDHLPLLLTLSNKQHCKPVRKK